MYEYWLQEEVGSRAKVQNCDCSVSILNRPLLQQLHNTLRARLSFFDAEENEFRKIMITVVTEVRRCDTKIKCGLDYLPPIGTGVSDHMSKSAKTLKQNWRKRLVPLSRTMVDVSQRITGLETTQKLRTLVSHKWYALLA